MKDNKFEKLKAVNEKGKLFEVVTPCKTDKGVRFAVTKDRRVFCSQFLRLYELTWSTEEV